MAVIGSSTSNAIIVPWAKANPVVQNVTLVAANTEYSHSFPLSTKHFEIKTRPTHRPVKLSYATGTSASVYRTIEAGSTYSEENITQGSLTIYVQSTYAGVVLEITSWS